MTRDTDAEELEAGEEGEAAAEEAGYESMSGAEGEEIAWDGFRDGYLDLTLTLSPVPASQHLQAQGPLAQPPGFDAQVNEAPHHAAHTPRL